MYQPCFRTSPTQLYFVDLRTHTIKSISEARERFHCQRKLETFSCAQKEREGENLHLTVGYTWKYANYPKTSNYDIL